MGSACMTLPSIWRGVALAVARSQWLILGCFPSPTVAARRTIKALSTGAGTGRDFERSVNPAHRVLAILRTID
jgi:hypothetical protein